MLFRVKKHSFKTDVVVETKHWPTLVVWLVCSVTRHRQSFRLTGHCIPIWLVQQTAHIIQCTLRHTWIFPPLGGTDSDITLRNSVKLGSAEHLVFLFGSWLVHWAQFKFEHCLAGFGWLALRWSWLRLRLRGLASWLWWIWWLLLGCTSTLAWWLLWLLCIVGFGGHLIGCTSSLLRTSSSKEKLELVHRNTWLNQKKVKSPKDPKSRKEREKDIEHTVKKGQT